MTICNKYPKELTHYDKQLKKNFFRKLRQNVWESKTKWRLMLKAQRNYHHKLTLRALSSWSSFTAYKLRKKEKLESANEHFAWKTKHKAFSALKRKVEKRWSLKKKLGTIQNFKTKRRAWIYWRKYVRKAQRSKEIYVLTQQIREIYLVRKYIKLWFVSYNEKNFNEMKYLRAAIHHNISLKRRFFIVWINYRNMKNFKRELASHFTTQLELKLKKRHFKRLMQYTKHKKLYEKHVRCVTLFYETYVIRNAVDKWFVKYEVLVESRNRDKQELAVKFYEESLLGRSFRKLKNWSDDEKTRRDAADSFLNIKIKLHLDLWRKYHRERLVSSSLEEKAQKWRNHQLKFVYLTKMKESFEEKRREKNQIENFIKFCEMRLMRETFHRFRLFLSVKRKKNVKFHSAQHHHDVKIARKFFRLLQFYTTRRIRKSGIINYRKFRLLSKSFNRLRRYSANKREYRDRIDKFRERCRLHLLRRAFSVLNDENKNNGLKYSVAREAADGKIMKKTFQQWKKYHEKKVQKNVIVQKGMLQLKHLMMRNMLMQWRKKSLIRTTFKQDLNKVKINQDKRLVKSYLKKWLDIIDKFRILRENFKAFHGVYADAVMQFYLLKMIDVWNGRRLTKDRFEFALRMEKRLLMKRYYNRWVTYVSWKKEKLKECAERIFFPIQPEKCLRYSKARLRRKQPMIPLFLRRELLLCEQEETVSGSILKRRRTNSVFNPVDGDLHVMR